MSASEVASYIILAVAEFAFGFLAGYMTHIYCTSRKHAAREAKEKP